MMMTVSQHQKHNAINLHKHLKLNDNTLLYMHLFQSVLTDVNAINRYFRYLFQYDIIVNIDFRVLN